MTLDPKKGRERILLSRTPGQTIMARMVESQLDALEIDVSLGTTGAEALRTGDILLARTVRALPGAGGALVDLGDHGTGFLPLGKPVLARRPHGDGWQIERAPQEGLAVLVQVVRLGIDGEGGKGPRLKADMQLPGRFCVYRPLVPEGPRVKLSRHLGEAETIDVRGRLEAMRGGDDGFILRTKATGADPTRIADEAQGLRADWQEVLDQARQKAPPSLIWRDGPVLKRVLREWLGTEGTPIVVDEPGLARETMRIVEAFGLPDPSALVDVVPPGQSVLTAFDLESEIEALSARRVALVGGGSVIIDMTEALTAVDVNGAGRGALETNLDAARMIGRQLRLRDIGGLIIIDFADPGDDKARSKVTARLRDELAKDPAPFRIGSFSASGTLDLTRARSGAGLADRWQTVCPTCQGTGRVATAQARALALLRALPTTRPGARTRIRVGSTLATWLTHHQDDLKQAFEALGRMPPDFAQAPDMGPLDWSLEEEGRPS